MAKNGRENEILGARSPYMKTGMVKNKNDTSSRKESLSYLKRKTGTPGIRNFQITGYTNFG